MAFVKGKSGNPNGRPKVPEEFKGLARKASLPALKRAVDLINSEDENVALKACEIVMSRAWGKPAQPATGEAGEGPAEIVIRWEK